MKTTTTTTKLAALFIAAFFLLASPAKAFSSYPSIGVKMNWSGNGLAAAPAITFRYSFSKLDVDFGANYQMHGSRFSGCQTNFTYYVQPPTRKVRLGFFAGVRYFYSASLKPVVVAQEKWKQPESQLNFDELQMRCIEGQVGFGLRVQYTQHISSFFGIGAGAYQTLGDASQYAGMHRQLNQAQLSLNCSLSYSFR